MTVMPELALLTVAFIVFLKSGSKSNSTNDILPEPRHDATRVDGLQSIICLWKDLGGIR